MVVLAKARVSVAQSVTSKSRWLILIPLFLMWFFGQADKNNLSVVIASPNFLGDLNFLPHSPALGALMTWFLVGYGVSNVVWGFLIDRLPSKIVALVVVLIWGLSLAWFGAAESHNSLYSSRFVLGLGEGALYPLSNHLIANWLSLKRRGTATSIWWCGVGAGPMVVTPLFAVTVSEIGWRNSFFSMGLLQIVLLVPLVLLIIREAPKADPTVELSKADQEERDTPLIGQQFAKSSEAAPLFFLRSPVYWGTVLCNVASGQSMWGSTTWLLTYLFLARHYSLVQSGLFIGFGFFLQVVLTLLIGFLSDRDGRRAPYGIILYVFIIVAMGTSILSPWALLSAFAVSGVIGGLNAAPVVFQSLLHSYIPRYSMGRASGIMSFVNNTLASLSPIIIGAMVGISNNWELAFVWLAFWPLICLFIMIWFRRLGL